MIGQTHASLVMCVPVYIGYEAADYSIQLQYTHGYSLRIFNLPASSPRNIFTSGKGSIKEC